MCLYTGSHLWWEVLGTFLSRKGSLNGFDQQRNSGQAAWNMGLLCGQSPEDSRFDGQPTVTCSDNAAHHANRVDPDAVAQIPVFIFHGLLERRLFDHARLFDRWHLMVLDGSVKEKCRQGFNQAPSLPPKPPATAISSNSRSSAPKARFCRSCTKRWMLVNPETEKEDCELNAFHRLSQRLKKEFPKLPICLVADSLYGCQAVAGICRLFDWMHVLTLKEGRQPTTWDEVIRLLPFNRANRLRLWLGQDGKSGQQDFRWIENVMLGEHQTNVILQGEITDQPSATLYAYITNFPRLTPQRVTAVVNNGGRERHLIEDTFNAQKNNGIGLEHVFCANATASKNYYTMMQVAEVLWTLTCQGGLRRLYPKFPLRKVKSKDSLVFWHEV